MKSIVYQPSLFDRSNSIFLNDIGRKISLANKVKFKDVADPIIPDEYYVKLKTRMCGICATDLIILNNNKNPESADFAFSGATRREDHILLGHEVVAEVVEVGNKVKKIGIGDRVVIADDKNCETFGLEQCNYCDNGLPLQCVNKHKRKYYRNVGAGWSEYFVRHENQLFIIPDNMDDDVAVLMEPATVSLHSVLRAPPSENNRVLVIGGGVIGLGIVSALRSLNLRSLEIVLLGRYQFQRDKALALGADKVVDESKTYEAFSEILKTPLFGKKGNQILNNGFNYVYDCVSSASTINDSLRWLAPRGSLVMVGLDGRKKHIDLTSVVNRELNILGVHGYAHSSFEGKTQHTLSRCVDWVSRGRYDVKSLLTHKYHPEKYIDALDTAMSHQSKNNALAEKLKPIKVAFDFSFPRSRKT